VVRLLQFTAERKEPLVTLSMGEIGMLSRVAAPLFGSLFTYTFVGEAVAPGQLPFGELVAEMRRYYPSLAENS
jgi:3-dehydroquinate dehydratase-1